MVGTAAAGALLATSVGAAAPAAGAAARAWTWGPLVDLAASRSISRPDVVLGPHGTATVVWRTQNGVVAITRSPAGRWGPPHRLGNGTAPAAAIDGRGGVTAIWVRHLPGMGPQVMTAHRDPGEHWSRARALSAAWPSNGSAFPGAFRPRLAMSHDGAAVATWMWGADDSGGSRVQARYRPAGGSWRAAVLLSPVEARTPEPAIGDRGRAVVVYTVAARVYAVRRAAGGWGPRELVGRHAEPPQVAMDDAGRATATWSAYDVASGAFHPQAATAAPGRPWRAPVTLDPTPTTSEPVVGTTAAGRSTVAWTRAGTDVMTSAHVPGRAWTAPLTVASPGPGVGDSPPALGLTVGRSGAALLTWTAGGPSGHLVEAAHHPAGAGWGAPSTLSDPADDAAAAASAVGPGGVTAWRAYDDTGAAHLQLRFLSRR